MKRLRWLEFHSGVFWAVPVAALVALFAVYLLLTGCYIGAGSPVTAGWNANSAKPQVAAVEAVFDSSTATKEYDFPVYEPEALE